MATNGHNVDEDGLQENERAAKKLKLDSKEPLESEDEQDLNNQEEEAVESIAGPTDLYLDTVSLVLVTLVSLLTSLNLPRLIARCWILTSRNCAPLRSPTTTSTAVSSAANSIKDEERGHPPMRIRSTKTTMSLCIPKR